MKSLARHIVSQETTKRMLGAGRPFLIAGTCALILAGCSGTIRNVNAVKFDGHYFAGRASKSSVDPHGFSVRIRNAAKSIAGAREAARYEGRFTASSSLEHQTSFGQSVLTTRRYRCRTGL